MIKPFDVDYLVEVNEEIEVVVDDGVIIIDNFYKNFDALYDVCSNMHIPSWKKSENSRNFIDYFDCRPVFQNSNPGVNFYNKFSMLKEIIQKVYEIDGEMYLDKPDITFNYYKNIEKNVSNNMQFYPHKDHTFNCLVYIDHICSGGTALYNMDDIENKEDEYVLYDVSGIEKHVIEAKQNRMVIFHGDIMHGGYIKDHTKYENDWRINEVSFLHIDEIKPRVE